jgi:CrcB protein
MKTLVQYLAVGGAGFLGAITRLAVGRFSGQVFGTDFPWGTLIINVTGSFILGWFMEFARARVGISQEWQLAIAVGFVGAYTTFSTYMFESMKLMNTGEWLKAGANLIGSIILGLIAVRLGIYAGAR